MRVLARPQPHRLVLAALIGFGLWPGAALSQDQAGGGDAPPPPAAVQPPRVWMSVFASFDLPDAWEAAYWADADVQRLLKMPLKDIAALVPTQAGLKHCRCPKCGLADTEEPLQWTLEKPDLLKCRVCASEFPNDTIPLKVNNKIPEEAVDVAPGLVHKYPYHVIDTTLQHYPEERVYLSAKRDYHAREFLSKAALYAAVRYQEQGPGSRKPALAQIAAVILLRCAQVYPSYSVHFDQPGQPPFFQPANVPPPYRHGYQSAKWDWLGCLDVPINLVIAYALLAQDPAIDEAGKLLGDPQPRRTIELNLFRTSAEFALAQPEEYSEQSVYVYRGLLAVGRLLNDPELVHEAVNRLRDFAQRGFYFDGYWRDGDHLAHARVMGLINGWIDRLLRGYSDPPSYIPHGTERFSQLPGSSFLPQLHLARQVAAALQSGVSDPSVLRATWPASPAGISAPRGPLLLGGAGLVRLSVGHGDNAMDATLTGHGDFNAPRFQRLSMRLSVAGQPVLGDLDDLPPMPDGFDKSTASHNTLLIDGLNQRESLDLSRTSSPGANLRFFAADPDLQVVAMEDQHAYPITATRYRRILLAAAGQKSRYIVDIFDAAGGSQHLSLHHATTGSKTRWRLSSPTSTGPRTLLPPSLVYLPSSRAEDGRWFVQALGALHSMENSSLDHPALAALRDDQGVHLKLHVLSDLPELLITALGPEPDPALPDDLKAPQGRAALIQKRSSTQGKPLESLFVSLLEPSGPDFPQIRRVGRINSPPRTVALFLQTDEGDEHLIINLDPGKEIQVQLLNGSTLTTDGFVVRLTPNGSTLVGGTFVSALDTNLVQRHIEGTITAVSRYPDGNARGAFRTDKPVPEAATLPGRCLLIRHGDGSSHGWTIDRVAPDGAEGSWIFVREEPGFELLPTSGNAAYYQFPRLQAPPPHYFTVDRITR